MKIPTVVPTLPLLLLLVAFTPFADAASFSAELVETRAGQSRTGPFYYQDKSYRFELVDHGQTLIFLVDGVTGTLRVLNTTEKAYYEAQAGDPMSLFANPFALYAQFARTKEVRTESTESVSGVMCKKQVVSGGEQAFVTGWISDEFELPLKIHTPLDDRTIELRKIAPGAQDPALFAVPAGYRLEVVEKPREPQPEWAGEVAKAPLLTPPFEKTLPTGGIVRVRPRADQWIEIAGTNSGKVEGSFTAAPFKDGKYIGGGSMGTVILQAGDSSAMNSGARPATTDELVVRVGQGPMKIKVAYVAPSRTGPEATPVAAEPEASAPATATDLFAEVRAPESAPIATRLEIFWQGPAERDDYIAIARPDQARGAFVERTLLREGNPLKVWTPSDPGTYQVRYVAKRGTKLLATSLLTVTGVPANVMPAGPVKAAAWIEVMWEGPARDGDFISVASPGQPPGAALTRTAVREGNPLKVRAPSDAGTFEVRYVLGRGSRVLATAPISIEPVTAEISPPATVAAGAEVTVAWQGPGYPEDFVALTRADQPAGASLQAASVRKGNPAKLRAPKEPGTYEVRYILGRGNRLLAKTTITVTMP